MARTFTPHDLTEGITQGQYLAMSEADKDAFDVALFRLWEANAAKEEALFLEGDYGSPASNRRSGWGS